MVNFAYSWIGPEDDILQKGQDHFLHIGRCIDDRVFWIIVDNRGIMIMW